MKYFDPEKYYKDGKIFDKKYCKNWSEVSEILRSEKHKCMG